MKKTVAEIRELIDDWKSDPCWDLEDTEGFEEHREFLTFIRINQETIWHEEYLLRLEAFQEKHHLPLTEEFRPVAEYLMQLQCQISVLREEIQKLKK